jgi:hypothetical protein
MSHIRVGLASSCAAWTSGSLPQERSRPSSSPARLVQKVVSPINCCGVAFATTSSSTPRSRNTSMVRWLVMWARGVSARRE